MRSAAEQSNCGLRELGLSPTHGRGPLTSFSSSHLSFSNSYTSVGRRLAVGRRGVASGAAHSDLSGTDMAPQEDVPYPSLLSAVSLGVTLPRELGKHQPYSWLLSRQPLPYAHPL